MENKKLLTDLFKAYYDARRHKRNTASQLRFEMNLETNLIELYHDLLNRSYKVGRSICFIVFKPVQREIFAANFRDRVVHHLLYNYVSPLLENTFIEDSYSCRVGKGTSKGVKRLEHHIRSCSQNYIKRAYVLKMDIQGFFMSINRYALLEKVKNSISKCCKSKKNINKEKTDAIDLDFVNYLLEEIILNDPTENCIMRGDKSNWIGLPPSKSLFHSPKGVGLPIGNLTSQLFSNVFLNDLDQYVKRKLGVKHYGRYVDDFYIIDADKSKLLLYREAIKTFLAENLNLKIHPKKCYLQDVLSGVNFLGVTLKPHRNYVMTNTRKRFARFIYETEKLLHKRKVILAVEELNKVRAAINSYLGYIACYKSFGFRHKIMLKCNDLTLYGEYDRDIRKFNLIQN